MIRISPEQAERFAVRCAGKAARSLARFIPGMSEALRMSLFHELGALPVFEPPGILFTMWEALLPPMSASHRASLYPRRHSWRVKHLA